MLRTCKEPYNAKGNPDCNGHVMFYTTQRIQYLANENEQGFKNFMPNNTNTDKGFEGFFGTRSKYFIDSDKLVKTDEYNNKKYEIKGGFIHSSGNDYLFEDDPGKMEYGKLKNSMFGIDENSVRYTSLLEFGGYKLKADGSISDVDFRKSTLFYKNFSENIEDVTPRTAITIFRPLNEIKQANYTNFYKFEVENTKGKVYISKNTIARSELEDLRISENVRKVDENGNFIGEYLSEYNSVNVGDTLHYRLCLENMTYKIDNKDAGANYTVNVSATLPDNTVLVKRRVQNNGVVTVVNCQDKDCEIDKSTNTITWKNVKLLPNTNVSEVNNVCDNHVGYTVKVTGTNDENILYSAGMKVNKVDDDGNVSNNALTMAPLKVHIVPTVDDTYATKFLNKRTSINEAITNGKISIVNNEANVTSTNSFKNTIENINNGTSNIKMLPSQVIKLLYYNVFDGMNIGNIGYYAEGNSSGNNGVFKKFVDKSNYTNYTIRLSYSSGDTNGKILIPGLYGGRKVRGNLDLKRESIIKIEYLEVGDLILSTEDDGTKKYWIYLGKNENGKVRMLFFDTSTNKLLLAVDQDSNLEASILFNKIYRKRTYAILRPNSQYLSKISYINKNTGKEYSSEFKSTGVAYKKLPNIEEGSITIEYNYNNVVDTANTSVTTSVKKGSTTKWYTSSNLDNSSQVTVDSLVGGEGKLHFYNLYSKNTYEAVKLPNIEKIGYSCSWNTKEDGTGTTYNVGGSYSLNENTTLYAVCDESKYTITFDGNGATDMGTTSLNAGANVSNIEIPKKVYNVKYNLMYDDIIISEEVSYIFDGYYTEKDGNGEKYFDSDGKNLIIPTKNIQLYANWKVANYKLFTPILRDNYQFLGWCIDNGSVLYKAGEDYLINKDITFSAKWKYDFNIDNDTIKVDDTNKVISGILLNDDVESLLSKINDEFTNISIKDVDGNIKANNEILKTGDVIELLKGDNNIRYEIIVTGDVTGDGISNIGDVAKAYQVLKGKIDATYVYRKAADVVGDDTLLINDISKLYTYVKGKLTSLI